MGLVGHLPSKGASMEMAVTAELCIRRWPAVPEPIHATGKPVVPPLFSTAAPYWHLIAGMWQGLRQVAAGGMLSTR